MSLHKFLKLSHVYHAHKGAALIIVIFAMMLFAILGWTLANLQSGSSLSTLSTLDSERALNLAEAGQEWAMNQLSQNSSWRTGNGDSDCNDNGDWLAPHTLGIGQYSVCCRNPTVTEQTSATVVIESRGYSPAQATPRAVRQTKILLQLGSFDKVLQAKNIFDWSQAIITVGGGSRGINGNIQAGYYDRDGDTTYNEIGVDYADPNLPVGQGGNDRRFVASEPFPTINMTYFESEATTQSFNPPGPNTWAPALTATITNITEVGGMSQVDLNTTIFSAPLNQWNGQALRNIKKGSWQTGSWEVIASVIDNNSTQLASVVDWAVGDRVTLIPKISSFSFNATNSTYTINLTCPVAWTVNEAVRDFNRGSWDYTDWGVIRNVTNGNTRVTVSVDDSVNLTIAANRWQAGEWIGEVKRYRDGITGQALWYIMADVLFDVRDRQSWETGGNDRSIVFRRTNLVAEGDIGIRGPQRIHFSERPLPYPNLATKNGSITSPDNVGSAGRRDFDDIVFSENGDIIFNYLDARAIFGNNVIVSGVVRVRRYDNDLLRLNGFGWGFSTMKWKEE